MTFTRLELVRDFDRGGWRVMAGTLSGTREFAYEERFETAPTEKDLHQFLRWATVKLEDATR